RARIAHWVNYHCQVGPLMASLLSPSALPAFALVERCFHEAFFGWMFPPHIILDVDWRRGCADEPIPRLSPLHPRVIRPFPRPYVNDNGGRSRGPGCVAGTKLTISGSIPRTENLERRRESIVTTPVDGTRVRSLLGLGRGPAKFPISSIFIPRSVWKRTLNLLPML